MRAQSKSERVGCPLKWTLAFGGVRGGRTSVASASPAPPEPSFMLLPAHIPSQKAPVKVDYPDFSQRHRGGVQRQAAKTPEPSHNDPFLK